MINRYFENQFPLDIGWTEKKNHVVLIENRISALEVGTDTNLTGVVIGNDLSIIKNNCFLGCSNLESVDFLRPNQYDDNKGTRLISIGNNAFKDCIKLSSIIFNDCKVQDYIGTNAFTNSGLSSIDLITKNVNAYAFSNISNMTSATLDVSEKINIRAFYDDRHLNKCFVSANILDENVFSNTALAECHQTKSIKVSAKTLNAGVFKDSGWDEIILDGVEYMNHGPFEGGITRVEHPDWPTEYYYEFKNGLYKSGSVTLAESTARVKYFDKDILFLNFKTNGIFENCTNLTSISLPSSLKSITSYSSSSKNHQGGANNIVDYNTNGKKMDDGRTISSNEFIQVPLFRGCINLRSISVDITNLTSLYPAVFAMIQDPSIVPATGNTLSIYFNGTQDKCIRQIQNLDYACKWATNLYNIPDNNPDCIVIFEDGQFDPLVETVYATKLCYSNIDCCQISSVGIFNMTETGEDFKNTVAISAY